MISRKISAIVLWGIALFFGAVLAWAQEKKTEFVLDFLSSTINDSQKITTVDAQPVFIGKTFSAALVLKEAAKLVGVNCDIAFDPAVLRVVDIHESRGDINFDGRSNIADILTLGERFGEKVSAANVFGYFDRDRIGDGKDVLNLGDINALLFFLNERNLYWTSNSNDDFTLIRESVEIFESPELIQQRAQEENIGLIDDIASVLLFRPENRALDGTVNEGLGFNGDARICDITFEIIGGASGQKTSFQIKDGMAIDEKTVVTADDIVGETKFEDKTVEIILP
ncbi:MAG: hypothetical protein AB1656_07555 [Candidatus Omnitrophota bacterium]